MNKNKLSFYVFLFALFIQSGALRSQELQTIQKLGLGINGLDLAVEIPLAENITIEPAVGLGPSYDFWDDDIIMGRTGFGWALLEPSVHASVYGKLFYNRDKRIRKRKSMLLNSGKFIGLKIKYVSTPLTNYEYHGKTNTLIANLNWGGQRNIGKHWNYSYFVGVSYGRNLDSSYGTLYPGIDFKVAYVLPFLRGK